MLTRLRAARGEAESRSEKLAVRSLWRHNVSFEARWSGFLRKEVNFMSSDSRPLQLGGDVPNFDLACYDPVKNDFVTKSLDDIKSQGKWTILFFYPADFTFV
jgi:AhpC/TSA family